jgi:hypothetical protein
MKARLALDPRDQCLGEPHRELLVLRFRLSLGAMIAHDA